MAQLTDDCFAFSGPLLPLQDMERLIGERIVPVGDTEILPLRNARGRITATDVIAPVDLPPFDNSAVDGYAVRHADLASEGDADSLQSDGESLYRACTPGSHHHHLICRRCGTTVEIAVDAVETWARDVASEHGFTQPQHVVDVFGYCAECSRVI